LVRGGFTPDVGDIVWLQFDPQAGHEQAGRRPALVLTPARYNAARGMMLCCPMTTKVKGYVFEVLVDTSPRSVALVDQIKSLDWRARGAQRKGQASHTTVAEARAKLKALLSL
jgi:mRNA interferase MazF